MKTLSKISAAAMLATTFAIPAWAGPVGMVRTAPEAQANTAQANTELISQLQEASDDAAREGRTGNKNNIAFGQKTAQISNLIERLKAGQKVDPAEIDQAFEPVRVW